MRRLREEATMALTPEQAKAAEQANGAAQPEEVEQSDGIRLLNDEEAREHFDKSARYLLGISGDEFLRRYDAGYYDRELEDRELRGVMKLRMMENFVR
jgi:hypothetical protein